MQISYQWLQELLPVELTINELSEILTSIGLEVEGTTTIEQIKGSLKGVVVGEVMECVQHPNADKLKITKVNIGEEEYLNIVCGAPNVAAGQKVLVATISTILYPTDSQEGFQIKPAKIRGESSHGMLCAEDELGMGKSHDGILVLPQETTVGMPAAEYFNLGAAQTMIEIGLTPNRSDAMSHIGVARDVCTYLTHHRGEKFEVNYPEINAFSKVSDFPISINVQDYQKCPRYAGVVINNVAVKESPDWIKVILNTIGQKSINNIVDITNIVLHEYGQPLHAFDYSSIENNTIEVKTLPKDTIFTTLDQKERKLNEEDLMLCDASKALCMAGVMGGMNSGVNENTTTIFLESAFFDPKTIRRSSMRHQLRTDAATHFEKTVDVDQVIPALNRAISLILEIAGGEVASDILDIYPTPFTKKEVTVQYDYIGLLCGKVYQPSSIDNILTSMGFTFLNKSDKFSTVQVPFSKSDIEQGADIAEEILRIDGLNNVSIQPTISYSLPSSSQSNKKVWKEKICQWLTDQGLHEILTNSIVNSKDYNLPNIVHMINSLSAELNALRPSMLKSGLSVLEHNINRGMKDLMIYEWGNVYGTSGEGKYYQEERLAIWTTGNRSQITWQNAAIEHDIYYIKGLVEGLAKVAGLSTLKVKIDGQKIQYLIGKKIVATIEQVPLDVLKKSGIKQAVYYAEIFIKEWLTIISNSKIQYQEINKFPSVERDLSLVLKKEITYDQIESVTIKKPITALKSYKLFDIYEGEKLGKDKRAWAINYVFQLEDKTMTDAEVDSLMSTLILQYEKELNAEIRK